MSQRFTFYACQALTMSQMLVTSEINVNAFAFNKICLTCGCTAYGRDANRIIKALLWCPIKMRAAFLASILPRVMKEDGGKKGSSHFDEKLSV